MSVCKVKCNVLQKNTQRKTNKEFKHNMMQHFGEVQKLVKLGKKSDSHSGHFATRSTDATSFPSCQREGVTFIAI